MKKIAIVLGFIWMFQSLAFGQVACADCVGACINLSLTPVFGVENVNFSISDSEGNVVYSDVSPVETGDICLASGCYSLSFIDNNGADPNLITVHIEDGEGNILVDLVWGYNVEFLPEIPFCVPGECEQADFNCDMIINANDLLSFLLNYGCLEGCDEGDFNEDGAVNANDLLIFLGLI
jgi:hypothetical protein